MGKSGEEGVIHTIIAAQLSSSCSHEERVGRGEREMGNDTQEKEEPREAW